MIITITLNPALDRTLRIEHPLEVGKLNRSSSSHLEPGGKGINVSRAVKALGGNSIALGFTAGTNGRVMKDMLTAADIHYDLSMWPVSFASIPRSLTRRAVIPR